MEAGPNLVPGIFPDCDNTDEFLVDFFIGFNGSADAGVDLMFKAMILGHALKLNQNLFTLSYI